MSHTSRVRASPLPTASLIANIFAQVQHGSLRKDLCDVPITALATYRTTNGQSRVLSGEDGAIVLYDASSGAILKRLPIFSRQPIHGIRMHEPSSKALIWGSSCVAVLSLDSWTAKQGEAHDWIFDGAFDEQDPSRAVLVTAHNEIVILRTETVTFESSIISPSRPMLYTATLRWTGPEEVLVAAGTVFGDVLVWKCRLVGKVPQMLFSLSGHEGSIFGVDISPLMTLEDGSSVRLLASCSDDRTIRVWNISEEQANSETTSTETEDTGFRCAPTYDGDAPDQGRSDVKPIAMAMGHASRIWAAKFGFDKFQGVKVQVYSFGEDATTQRWSFDVSQALKQPVVQLKHERTFGFHNGKHLWSRALQFEDEKTVIITGGADSRITMIDDTRPAVSQAATAVDNNLLVMETKDILSGVVTANKKNAEVVGRYDFLTPDSLLAITNMGRLAVSSIQDGNIKWEEVSISEDVVQHLRNCYVLRATGNGCAILGATTGDLYLYRQPGEVTHIATLPGRIMEMNIVDTFADYTGINFVTHLYGTAGSHFLSVDVASGKVQHQEKLEGLDERFVAVSASVIGDILALGSRHGWITMFRSNGDGFVPVANIATRSRDAITAMVALPRGNTDKLYVLATSRDGIYRIYQLHDHEETVALELIHEVAPPFGPMIEGAWFTDDVSPELMLYGFRSKDFIVWNESRREEAVSMDCGGAHRTFRLSRSAARYRFAFTRTSKLCLRSQDGVAQRPLKLGTHGREIRAISSNTKCIATGAEDTSIRIWSYGENKQMEHLATMKTHITGIQQIRWLGDERLFTSAGNEELFAWRVRPLDSIYKGIGVMREAVFDDKSPIGDLRIMDIDVSWLGGDQTSGVAVITLAVSSSQLKSYVYKRDEETGTGAFELLGEASYTGACLMQVQHLGPQSTEKRSVLTASTDGHICLWKAVDRTYELQWSFKIHQNAIKSLDMVSLAAGGYALLTGGDDNALAYTVLELSEDSWIVQPGSCKIIRSAHAAAVTGVAIVHQDDQLVGISGSNDQQIKSWALGDGLRCLSESYSGVADPGDVAVLAPDRGEFAVGGVGFEVWAVGEEKH